MLVFVFAPQCPLCVDLDRPADHIWGSRGCVFPEEDSRDRSSRPDGSRVFSRAPLDGPLTVSDIQLRSAPSNKRMSVEGAGDLADISAQLPPTNTNTALTSVGSKIIN